MVNSRKLSGWLFCSFFGAAVAAENNDAAAAKQITAVAPAATQAPLYGEVSGHDRPMLLIPLEPVQQKISTRMQQVMQALAANHALENLHSWTSRRELPKWALDRANAEIVYVPPRPSVSDDYRYGVILGATDRVIVVRAGGISGSYEVFERPTRRFLWLRSRSTDGTSAPR